MKWRTLCAVLLVSAAMSSPVAARTLGDYAEFSARRASAAISTSCMPAALKAALARIKSACGRVQVISGHRPGARVAGSGRPSYHASCRAVDFHAPRACALRVLAGWNGGLGTYSGRMTHIHLDTGPQVRFAHGGGRTRVASRRSARHRVAQGRGFSASRRSASRRTASRRTASSRRAASRRSASRRSASRVSRRAASARPKASRQNARYSKRQYRGRHRQASR